MKRLDNVTESPEYPQFPTYTYTINDKDKDQPIVKLQEKFKEEIFNVKTDTVDTKVEEVLFDGHKMRKVHIQDKIIRTPFVPEDTKLDTSAAYWTKFSSEKVLFSQANIMSHPELSKEQYETGLFGALVYAYNNHADIVLSPDDIWITVLKTLASHIYNNSDKFKDKLVSHAGKEQIHIPVFTSWQDLLAKIQSSLESKVKGSFAENCLCSFSTSGPVEKMASTVGLMFAVKKYFGFSGGCGIRNVYFMGTIEDWMKLRNKIEKVAEFGLKEWTNKMLWIVDHWIECYQGKLNFDFWFKMVDKAFGQDNSGIDNKRKDFTGWIIYLCGDSTNGLLRYVPQVTFSVPFVWKLADKDFKMRIFAGFSGMRYYSEAFRPQLSVCFTTNEKGHADE